MVRVTFKIIFLLAVAQAGGSLALPAANQSTPAPARITVIGRSEALATENIKKLASQQGKGSQEKLIAYINSASTPQTKNAAIEALVQRGDPGSALAIARLVQDPDPEIAGRACWAIGELRDRRTSAEAVRAMQQQIFPIVRVTCALAVGRINDPEGAPALNDAALNEKQDLQVRLAAIQALAMTDSERASSLSSLVANADPRIRASAAYSACQLHLPVAIDAVKAMLASKDPQTKGYGLLAAGLWPEKFSQDLAKIAADSDVPIESRLLGLTAMDALPTEQKKTAYAKLLLPLVKPDQPPDIQVAAAQLLSEVPEIRPELEHIATDVRRPPELLDRLNEIGIQTGVLVPTSRRRTDSVVDNNAYHPHDWVDKLNAFSTSVLAAFTILLFAGLIWQIRTSHNIERAWIIATPSPAPDVIGSIPKPSGPLDAPGINAVNAFMVSFKNTGNTPAVLIDSAVVYRRYNSLDELPAEPDYGQRGPFNRLPLVKEDSFGAAAFLQPNAILREAEVTAVWKKEAVLVAYGIITYQDVFRRIHETRFGYVYYVPLGGDPIPRGYRREGLPPAYNRAT